MMKQKLNFFLGFWSLVRRKGVQEPNWGKAGVWMDYKGGGRSRGGEGEIRAWEIYQKRGRKDGRLIESHLERQQLYTFITFFPPVFYFFLSTPLPTPVAPSKYFELKLTVITVRLKRNFFENFIYPFWFASPLLAFFNIFSNSKASPPAPPPFFLLFIYYSLNARFCTKRWINEKRKYFFMLEKYEIKKKNGESRDVQQAPSAIKIFLFQGDGKSGDFFQYIGLYWVYARVRL